MDPLEALKLVGELICTGLNRSEGIVKGLYNGRIDIIFGLVDDLPADLTLRCIET